MTRPPVPRPSDERECVLALLRAHAPELRARGVRSLALLGSVAHDEARPDSDVDLLLDLDVRAGVGFGVVSLKGELDRLVGRPVGLAFASRLRPAVRARIQQDLVQVFWDKRSAAGLPSSDLRRDRRGSAPGGRSHVR